MLVCPAEQAVGQGIEPGVIAYTQRGQRNLVISGVLKELLCLLVQDLGTASAHRTVGGSRLTEAASAVAAAADLKHNAVVHRFDIGHNHLVGEVDLVKIFDDLFPEDEETEEIEESDADQVSFFDQDESRKETKEIRKEKPRKII